MTQIFDFSIRQIKEMWSSAISNSMAQQTAKEKARELVDWFLDEGLNSFGRYQSSEEEDLEGAKFCTTKVVEIILDTIRIHLIKDPSGEEVVKFVETRIIYWQEVKQEIEKL